MSSTIVGRQPGRLGRRGAKTAIINAYDFMVQQGKNPGEMLPGGTSGAGAIWNWWNGTSPGLTPYGSGTGPGGMFSGNKPASGGGGGGTILPTQADVATVEKMATATDKVGGKHRTGDTSTG